MAALSSKTLIQYERNIRIMRKQAEEELPEGGKLTLLGLVYSAYSRIEKKLIAKSTWRQRRSSLSALLQGYIEKSENSAEAKEAMDVLAGLDNDGIHHKGLEKRASAKKKKFISKEDEETFLAFLLKRNKAGRTIAGTLHDWLFASRFVGARPGEWEFATLDNQGRAVVLVNGKATHGRSHGKVRTIAIDYLPKESQEVILRHIHYVQHCLENGESFEVIQKQMSNAVTRESKLCWPRRKNSVALYTMRHQFAANLKATLLDKDQVAALMGHASNETAGLHYARKIVGNPIEGIYAKSDELRRVRKLNEKRIPHSGNVFKHEKKSESDNH